MNYSDLPSKETFACAFCENHIDDGNEILRRTKEGWLPFHPACAPDEDKDFTERFYLGSSCCGRRMIEKVKCFPFSLPKNNK